MDEAGAYRNPSLTREDPSHLILVARELTLDTSFENSPEEEGNKYLEYPLHPGGGSERTSLVPAPGMICTEVIRNGA